MDGYAGAALRRLVIKLLHRIDDDSQVSMQAVQAISMVVEKFLSEVGRVGHGYTELAGRSQGAFYDAYEALQTLGVTLDDVRQMVEEEEQEVLEDVHKFPIQQSRELPVTLKIAEDEPEKQEKHIPSWLPPFPQRHTYIHSAMFPEEMGDEEAAKRKRETRERVEGYLGELNKKKSRVEEAARINPDAQLDAQKHEAIPLPPHAVRNPYIKMAAPYDPRQDPKQFLELDIDQRYSDLYGRDVASRKLDVVVNKESLQEKDSEAYQGLLKAERLIAADHSQQLATSEADI